MNNVTTTVNAPQIEHPGENGPERTGDAYVPQAAEARSTRASSFHADSNDASATQTPETAHPFADTPVIHRYTRADGIRDGILVDVTETAREAGFKIPTAITAAVHDECVRWTDEDAPPQAPDPRRTRTAGSGTSSGWPPAEHGRLARRGRNDSTAAVPG